MKKNKMIKVVNMGSEFLENYEKELIQNAEKKGKKEGRKEGKIEEKERFAKKLKEDNIPLEKIIQYTGLNLGVIKKL